MLRRLLWSLVLLAGVILFASIADKILWRNTTAGLRLDAREVVSDGGIKPDQVQSVARSQPVRARPGHQLQQLEQLTGLSAEVRALQSNLIAARRELARAGVELERRNREIRFDTEWQRAALRRHALTDSVRQRLAFEKRQLSRRLAELKVAAAFTTPIAAVGRTEQGAPPARAPFLHSDIQLARSRHVARLDDPHKPVATGNNGQTDTFVLGWRLQMPAAVNHVGAKDIKADSAVADIKQSSMYMGTAEASSGLQPLTDIVYTQVSKDPEQSYFGSGERNRARGDTPSVWNRSLNPPSVADQPETVFPDAGGVTDGAGQVKLAGRALVIELQRELQRLGCNPGPPDGKWGRRARRALARFASKSNMSSGVFRPDMEALAAMRAKRHPVCTHRCDQGEVYRKGQCVRKRRYKRRHIVKRQIRSQPVEAAKEHPLPRSADWTRRFLGDP